MNELPQVENDVPIPPRRVRNGFTGLLRSLQANQSVLLPVTEQKANNLAYRVFGRGAYRIEKQRGGTRVWRL